QVGTGAGADAQAPGTQPRGDGGDTGAQLVDTGADGVPSHPELFQLGAARRIGIPQDPARQSAGVLVQRRLAQVALAVKPEDVVAIEQAPDGREWVAPAPVDAADATARARRRRLAERLLEIRIDESFHGREQAFVLLADPAVAEGAAFLGDELG